MKRLLPAGCLGLALAVVGCGGGGKYVPVSGVVKVNGQPYKNAIVSFQPIAATGSDTGGLGSTALTDDQGRFVLESIDGKKGAVPGKHRVRIQTKRDDPTAVIDPTVGSDDSPQTAKKGQIEPIPVEWYSDSGNKEFTVPEAGTDQANFDIVSGKKK